MNDFNPKSPDAMFAKILTRLDQQDKDTEKRHQENKATLVEIREQTTLTNGRVTKLEQTAATVDRVKKLEDARIYFVGWVAGVLGLAGMAWAIFVHFWK